jgi:ribonuclease HI
MKKIKLEHRHAQSVLQGEEISTWRLFDDDNLSVNDEIELIDMVEVDRPDSWRSIGRATITKIIEKRLGDVQKRDMVGPRPFRGPEAMLEALKEVYGRPVTLATPVKIIFFDFEPEQIVSQPSKGQRSEPEIGRKIKIFADGGSRGNPGPSASGFVLLTKNNEIILDQGVYLGITTNNQAEYQALKLGLEAAQKLGVKEVEVYMDSLLVVNQMKGVFKVKNRDLWPIHQAIKDLAAEFEHVSFAHVPRELNKLADAAVNRALDEHLGIAPKKA